MYLMSDEGLAAAGPDTFVSSFSLSVAVLLTRCVMLGLIELSFGYVIKTGDCRKISRLRHVKRTRPYSSLHLAFSS